METVPSGSLLDDPSIHVRPSRATLFSFPRGQPESSVFLVFLVDGFQGES